ncbi:MAG: hypothetical protein KAH32_05160 [Chlamydiia bacterium]|nr:hypothetical protein [Chlamydiia bacterium]
MAKQVIRDIINRELIARTTQINNRHEYGIVGVDANIFLHQNKTAFRTDYQIDKISYVTINGVTQVLGRDYTQIDKFTIKFKGIILNDKTVNVVYFFKPLQNVYESKVPPVLMFFSASPAGGKDERIKFSFKYKGNDAKNIYWAIHKDGEAVPTLNSLGHPLTGTGHDVEVIDSIAPNGALVDSVITYSEAISRPGDVIPYTLIIVYDLTETGPDDEKLVGTVTYTVDTVSDAVLNIDITPSAPYTVPGVVVDYTIEYTVTRGSYIIDRWDLVDRNGNILDSGDDTNLPDGETVIVTRTYQVHDSSEPFYLKVAQNSTILTATDKINVAIPVPSEDAHFGWWASSRRSELTDAASYRTYVYDGAGSGVPGHNYVDHAAVKEKPATVLSPIVVDGGMLINDDVVNDEELANTGSVMFSNKLIVILIPNSWNSVQIILEGNQDITPDFTQVIDTDMNATWWMYAGAPITLYTELRLGITKI